MSNDDFQNTVWEYYSRHQRDMPWRHPDPDGAFDVYKILVSEIMLQQTQVNRVREKYTAFISKFPTITTLASAPLSDVLIAWQGLGYNRRAKYLHEAAKQLKNIRHWTIQDLIACKGVGANTAAAVLVYAYNTPRVFIETNIRTVFIYHFFKGADNVTDNDILPIIQRTLDTHSPREWYWALMDYGSYLKKAHGNAAKNSKHYKRQSNFKGSKRQLRGAVLRELTEGEQTIVQLRQTLKDDRLTEVLIALEKEGLIQTTHQTYHLSS